MRSLRDLIDCQEGSRKIPICQVGMGTEMRLCESLMNSEVSSYQQGMLVSGDSCGFADHVNEDDDKLKTCTTQEEDRRNLLMVGGIQIFLPGSPVEVRICVADEGATTGEGQPDVTVKGEVEQMLETAQEEENEHSKEWLNSFSQGAEETAALKLTAEKEQADRLITPWEMELEILEDWLNNPEPVSDFHQQMLAEEHSEELLRDFSQGAEWVMNTAVLRYAVEDEREFQAEEQLEEAGHTPAKGMAVATLSEEGEAEQQFSKKIAEMESAAGWQVKATRDEEDGMGDHDDLPICRKKLQQRRLHEQGQPGKQLDEMIEDIRRLMLRSAETASKEKLGRREATAAAAEQQKQQTAERWSRETAPKSCLGSRRISTARVESS
jgi:hypothetical protein